MKSARAHIRQASVVGLLLFAWPMALGAFYEWGGPARRGVRQLKKGENEAALKSLTEARAERPADAAVRYDQGIAFRRVGSVDSAAAAYEDALRLEGAAARSAAAYNLGNDALRANHLEEAIARYRASLRADPGRSDAKKNLEEAIRRSRATKPPQSPPSGGGGGAKGPSGPGAGGGGGGGEPNAPRQEDEAPRPRSTTGPTPSRAEAELWLKALESERRSEKSRERRQEDREERNQRDW